MPRFFCPQPLAAGLLVDLPESVAHHLHVVRQQPGDVLTLFNGEGGQYRATLVEVGKRRASASVDAFEPAEAELGYAITLAQALPEAAKMDWIIEKAVELAWRQSFRWIIEKAVELGVAAVVPLAARRCVTRLSGERAEKRQAHWQGIIVAASEQSGRNRLAMLAPMEDFSRWLARPAPGPRLLLSPRGTETLAAWAGARAAQDVTIMVGPEGGFAPEEEDAAITAGAIPLTMGPRVLRTETAALAAAAMLQARWA
jgi:16S rRNA (uracil1498-N3)-methyltransferase